MHTVKYKSDYIIHLLLEKIRRVGIPEGRLLQSPCPSVYPSVTLYACNYWRTAEGIFIKCDIGGEVTKIRG
jgi:hypothetical protein